MSCCLHPFKVKTSTETHNVCCCLKPCRPVMDKQWPEGHMGPFRLQNLAHWTWRNYIRSKWVIKYMHFISFSAPLRAKHIFCRTATCFQHITWYLNIPNTEWLADTLGHWLASWVTESLDRWCADGLGCRGRSHSGERRKRYSRKRAQNKSRFTESKTLRVNISMRWTPKTLHSAAPIVAKPAKRSKSI